jgi:hypothetical protein
VTATRAPADISAILQGLQVFHQPGDVVELRVTDTGRNRQVIAGYFDDLDLAAAAAARLSGAVPAVYHTINQVKPELLARYHNRLEQWAKNTTSDIEVVHRRWFAIDIDAVRVTGISASNEEHDAAIQLCREIYGRLSERGWSDPVVQDSGNGCYLIYPIDMATDEQSLQLLEATLEALAFRYNTDLVRVDQTVFNASRLLRVPGTLNGKGDSIEERPHRLSKFLGDKPVTRSDPVTPQQFQALIDSLRPDDVAELPAWTPPQSFDLKDFVAAHLHVEREGAWHDMTGDGYRWVLATSPLCPHDGDGPYIARRGSGAIVAGCHHASCTWSWADLREKFEPGYTQRRDDWADAQAQKSHGNGKGHAKPAQARAVIPEEDPVPPDPAPALPAIPLQYLPAPLAKLAGHMAGIWSVDPALYAVPGLACLSAAVGNTVRLQLPGGMNVPALLWLTIIARTGSGKTPAAECVFRPLIDCQTPLDAEFRALEEQWKALPRKERDSTERPEPTLLYLTDASWESVVQSLYHNPGGVLWWRDEVIGIFRQLVAFNAVGGAYGTEDGLSTWSLQPIRRRRIRDRELTIVARPYLPIFGGLQPARVGELGTNDSGRLSRLLPYRTDRWPALEGNDPDEGILKTWAELVTNLVAGRVNGGRDRQLHPTDGARQLWIERQQERARDLRESDEETAAYLAKLDQHAGRFAALKHASDHLDDDRAPVDVDTIHAGWELARVFLAHQLDIYRSIVPSFIVNPDRRAELEAVMALDKWVARQDGRARKREAQQKKIGGARTLAQHNQLVQTWVGEGLGHIKLEQPGPSVWLVRGPAPVKAPAGGC